MKILRGGCVCGVASLSFALAATVAVTAQAPGVGVEHGFGPGFAGSEFHGFGMRTPVTGAPYSAIRTTTSVQTLANGSTITHTNQVKEARDSSGRTYMETLPEAAATGGAARSFVRVFDPVSHESISWSANTKQATIVHLPEPGQFAGPRGLAGGDAARAERFAENNQAVTKETLGSKTINGIVVEGTRTTRVIPAGVHGNSEALTITHDSWVSPDMKLEIERVDTDPRFGTTTVEVTNVSRDEPSAALFQAPAGYQVKEMTMGGRRGGLEAAQ
jgi:hypothetical protein